MEKTILAKPVLFITDIWRDVDDALALTYLAWEKDLSLAWIITTKMIPEKRAVISRLMCDLLWMKDIPIWVWSIYPMTNEDPALLDKYLKETQINWTSFEWQWLLNNKVDVDSMNFTDQETVILEALEEYWDNLNIVILAPATDIAKLINKERKKFESIAWVYVMWQAKLENWLVRPDDYSYNLRLDMPASDILFSLQDKVPFTFLTKYAAYAATLNKPDFKQFAETNNLVWKYLDIHARKVLECSIKWDPNRLRKMLRIPDDVDLIEAYEVSDILSNPYDPFTIMAISNPDLFNPEIIWDHKIIWITKENHGLVSEDRVKKRLVDGILSALKK